MTVVVYPSAVLPDLVASYIRPYECRDPLLKRLTETNRRNLVGGTKWRIRLITAPHSNTTSLSATNLEVDLGVRSDIGYVEGDWPYLVRPIVMNHIDRARMHSKGEYKKFLDERTRATMADMNNEMRRRIYNGTPREAAWYGIGSFNGTDTSGTSTGLENGLIEFLTPTLQQSGASTYLGKARKVDTTYDFDNWYNQYDTHPGIGAGFLDKATELKDIADDYCPDGEGGIRFGILSRSSKRKLGTETRDGGGVAPHLIYTVEDIKAGRAFPNVTEAGGIMWYTNRFYSDTATGIDESAMLLNPDYLEWQVNEGMDYAVGPTIDFMETRGYAADVAMVKCQFQLAATMLHVHAGMGLS